MMARRPLCATRPILVTTAALADRHGLFHYHRVHDRVGEGSVVVVVPRACPAVAARLRRIAEAFAARRLTTLVTA
jgi:hypothetical protein